MKKDSKTSDGSPKLADGLAFPYSMDDAGPRPSRIHSGVVTAGKRTDRREEDKSWKRALLTTDMHGRERERVRGEGGSDDGLLRALSSIRRTGGEALSAGGRASASSSWASSVTRGVKNVDDGGEGGVEDGRHDGEGL